MGRTGKMGPLRVALASSAVMANYVRLKIDPAAPGAPASVTGVEPHGRTPRVPVTVNHLQIGSSVLLACGRTVAHVQECSPSPEEQQDVGPALPVARGSSKGRPRPRFR
jgi:hypothetical protein